MTPTVAGAVLLVVALAGCTSYPSEVGGCLDAAAWHAEQAAHLWGVNDTHARWHQGKVDGYRRAWHDGGECRNWVEQHPGHPEASA